MTVFVDTSAFYAVLDRSDDSHEAGTRVWIDLLHGEDVLLTSNYVVVETMALLQNRIGMDAVRTFVSEVLPVVRTTWIDEAAHHVALHVLLVSGRRGLTLVDCVSFHIMRESRIQTAFCFDSDFAEQGFNSLPAATST